MDISPESKIKRAAIFLLGVTVLIVVSFVVLRNSDYMKHDRTFSRFTSLESDPAVKTRLIAWKMAWNGVKERPILGWGQENYIGLYTVNRIPAFEGQAMVDRAHNVLIDWMITAGLLGLFSYLLILGYALYYLRELYLQALISRAVFITLFTSVVVYFIQNLFTFDTINTYLLFFTLLAYIDNLKERGDVTGFSGSIEEATEYRKMKLFMVIFIALLIFSFLAYYVNYKPMKVSRLSVHIRNDFPRYTSFTMLENDFSEALSHETFGSTGIRINMKLASAQIIKHNLLGAEGALDFMEKTGEELKKGIIGNQHNLDYLSHVISFYYRLARIEPLFIGETEELVKLCIRINPYYEEFHFNLADIYILKKDYERAFDIIDKAVSPDTPNDRKLLKLAEASILVSREDIAERALKKARKIRGFKDTEITLKKRSVFAAGELYQIAKAYLDIKNYEKALEMFKEITLIEPRNAGAHFEIAEIYLKTGDKGNAKKAAVKASELDPANYGEISRQFIMTIQ
jgi:tetratricopeptide (TPR) repeat protein